MIILNTLLFIIPIYGQINAVPSSACFAKFRWDDCGKNPVAVMYYYRPGSRCEVGVWRGCLPNTNMFHDEYECVSTCIYTARAVPDDYHQLNGRDDPTDSPEGLNVTVTEETTSDLNGTDTTGAHDATTDSSGNGTGGVTSGDSGTGATGEGGGDHTGTGPTGGGGDKTGATGEAAAATTIAA